MSLPSQDDVGRAIAHAGHYRTVQAQRVALEGAPDGISGALLLSLGLRETWLVNEQGGAKRDPATGKWVSLGPGDADLMDVGALQISRQHHLSELRRLPAVKNHTWGPVIPGKTPADYGYVPRWTDALRFTLTEMHEAIAYAEDSGVHSGDLIRFAVAAHNAGKGGALSGYRAGDVDKYTALGDYSKWVLEARTEVNRWLAQHPNWRV